MNRTVELPTTETEVDQQLDQLDLVLANLRAAIMDTDSQSLVEHSGSLQEVVNQLERHYDQLNSPNTQIDREILQRLGGLRRKLVGIGTLLQLSRAKAADLLELMLGTATVPATYAATGQMSLPSGGGRSLKV